MGNIPTTSPIDSYISFEKLSVTTQDDIEKELRVFEEKRLLQILSTSTDPVIIDIKKETTAMVKLIAHELYENSMKEKREDLERKLTNHKDLVSYTDLKHINPHNCANPKKTCKGDKKNENTVWTNIKRYALIWKRSKSSRS